MKHLGRSSNSPIRSQRRLPSRRRASRASSLDRDRREPDSRRFPQNARRGFDHLDVPEVDRRIVSQGDPEMAIALRLLKDVAARRFHQNGIGCVSGEYCGSGKLIAASHPISRLRAEVMVYSEVMY